MFWNNFYCIRFINNPTQIHDIMASALTHPKLKHLKITTSVLNFLKLRLINHLIQNICSNI
jgi:hypothetical protein